MRNNLGPRCLALLFLCAAAFSGNTPVQAAGQWLRSFGGPGSTNPDNFYDLEPVPAGGYIAVGSTTSFPGTAGNDVWVVRFDANGGILWEEFFSNPGQDAGFAVAVTQDGGFVVAAIMGLYSESSDAWILRLDPSGQVQWQKKYGGAGYEGSLDIAALADGGFVFVGWVTDSGSDEGDFWTVRLDSAGEIVWQRTFESGFHDAASHVRVTSDGAILVVGTSGSDDPVSYPTRNLLVKYDPAGQLLVRRCVSSWHEGEYPVDVVVLPDGGYVVTAATEIPWGGNRRTMLHRVNANLGSLWSRVFWFDFREFSPQGIAALPDGGVLVTARSFDQVGPSILRTDSNGSIVWHQGYGGAAANFTFGNLLFETDGIAVAGATAENAILARLSTGGLLPAACFPSQGLLARTQPMTFPLSCGGTGGTGGGTAQATSVPAVRSAAIVTTWCEDVDGDGLVTAEDNCPLASNSGQADADVDGVGDACDLCPTVYDPAQTDGDSDGRGDACDVCPTAPDPGQNDLDGDGEGDVCDTGDGMLFFTDVTRQDVSWQPDVSFMTYNLYRGSLPELQASGEYTQFPGSNPCASRSCGLAGTSVADGMVPLAGEPCFWLVTGSGPGGESGLEDPTSGPRANDHPCP